MLKIHVANCNGEKDKDPWADRLKWVDENLEDIERIATNPRKCSDLWVGVDSPFSYAAACRELISALDHRGHVSYLPIFFDATASGTWRYCLAIQMRLSWSI